MKGPRRIEIFGGIASGKTTLANLLSESTQARIALEKFRSNPFWSRFYRQPLIFAPEKNVCFLAQHTGEIKDQGSEAFVICDYAVFQDIAYASLMRDEEHLATMTALYQHLYRKLSPPTLFVHVQCTPKEQLRRIQIRARKQEVKSIQIGYLDSLNQAIDKFAEHYTQSAILRTIRSDEVDFANDPQERVRVKEDLLSIIGTLPHADY
jgi:deoxyguanosine kinase